MASNNNWVVMLECGLYAIHKYKILMEPIVSTVTSPQQVRINTFGANCSLYHHTACRTCNEIRWCI